MRKPTARAIPLISNQSQLQQYLQTWRAHVSKNLQRPPAPIIPWNFNATNMRGGIMLTWSPTPGADGYEVLRTDNGDFSGSPGSNLTVTPIRDPKASSYFDSLGGTATKKWYKIRATSGTHDAPHSVHGNASGIVTHTSIDSSDTVTIPSTIRDNATTQQSQTRAGGVMTRGGTGSGISGYGGDGIGGGVGGTS